MPLLSKYQRWAAGKRSSGRSNLIGINQRSHAELLCKVTRAHKHQEHYKGEMLFQLSSPNTVQVITVELVPLTDKSQSNVDRAGFMFKHSKSHYMFVTDRSGLSPFWEDNN